MNLLLLAALVAPVMAIGSVYALTARASVDDLGLELTVFAVLVATIGLVGWLRRRRLV